MDYETGVANLRELIASVDSDTSLSLNEATTRLHLIDRILIDCLGWPVQDIEAERHFRSEYTDYELGRPIKHLLVEAKREGKYFELPHGFGKSICQVRTLFDLSNDIKNAVEQAMRYCQTRGIALGVVANGRQLIAFVASRQDGLPPEEGQALVFESLQAMEARFSQLWGALSPAGIGARHLHVLLSSNNIKPPPDKLSTRLVDYPGFKNRNPVAAELQILGGLFIEDIARRPEYEQEFVRDTYCDSGALSQYALVSREILSARYSHYFEKETRVSVKPARTKKGIQPELVGDLVTASLSQRPIILVGDVGVGKSMFIKHLVYVEAREVLERAVVLYVDFGSKPTLSRDLPPYVVGEFERQLRDEYSIDVDERNFVRGVYNLELRRFETGVYGDLKDVDPAGYRKQEIAFLAGLLGDREAHLRASLSHIVKGQNRQVVIFLDNVDQRPLEFQEQVFLMGQGFAQNWPVTAFVALRPDTFAYSRASGSLAAYQPRVFTIDPPRVDRVIQKRLEYALDRLRETGRLPSFPQGFTLGSQRLEQYIEVLTLAFERVEEIIQFVDNMSNGNLRKALDFVATFVGSAHVDTHKIFRILEEKKRYWIPRHEFLRAVIFGDNEYYDPGDSPIINVFDIASADCREHFLVLLLLSYVERAGSIGGVEGFVPVANVYQYLQERQFSERQIEVAVQRCLHRGILASPRVEIAGSAERVRITPAGAYTAKKLVTLFEYVDAMIVDTPVTDESVRVLIQDERSTEGRLDRAKIFADYLDSCWDTSLTSEYDWPAQSQQLRLNIEQIESRIFDDS